MVTFADLLSLLLALFILLLSFSVVDASRYKQIAGAMREAFGLQRIDRLAVTLEGTTAQVIVAGHTDDTPIAGGGYRSNWELSAARAVSVVHYWLSNSSIDSRRLSAQGYADSRPRAANDGPEGRAANRRVEILIIED